MRRRALIAAAASLAGAPATAQTAARMAKVGYLSTGISAWRLEALRAGLRRHGFEGGRNLVILPRTADESYDALRGLAAELVALEVDVICTRGDTATRATAAATKAIPIVMSTAADPVASGLAASLPRPGGNVTGVVSLNVDLVAKRLELLAEALPTAKRVGMIFSPLSPSETTAARAAEGAAMQLGLTLLSREYRAVSDIGPAVAALAADGAEALAPTGSTLLANNPAELVEAARRHRLPLIVSDRDITAAGALLSYGPNARELVDRTADIVGRILRGARPGEIPIEQVTTFTLVVNLQAARALGATLPPGLVARADEVIE